MNEYIMNSARKALLFCGVAAAAGCSNPFQSDCIAIGVAGITATVVDASTNAAPTATPAVRLEDGAYSEELAAPNPVSNPPQFSGAVERPGTYRVTVRAAGYRDYVVEDVRVNRSGKCDYLNGVRLNIALVRAP